MPIINPTAKYACQRYGYRLPEIPHLSASQGAGKLYAVEERRNDLVMQNAETLRTILHLDDLWKEALPEALAALLDSMDTNAACVAAIAILHRQGYTVVDKDDA